MEREGEDMRYERCIERRTEWESSVNSKRYSKGGNFDLFTLRDNLLCIPLYNTISAILEVQRKLTHLSNSRWPVRATRHLCCYHNHHRCQVMHAKQNCMANWIGIKWYVVSSPVGYSPVWRITGQPAWPNWNAPAVVRTSTWRRVPYVMYWILLVMLRMKDTHVSASISKFPLWVQ